MVKEGLLEKVELESVPKEGGGLLKRRPFQVAGKVAQVRPEQKWIGGEQRLERKAKTTWWRITRGR